jgi:hypothetical protein
MDTIRRIAGTMDHIRRIACGGSHSGRRDSNVRLTCRLRIDASRSNIASSESPDWTKSVTFCEEAKGSCGFNYLPNDTTEDRYG